MNQVKSLAITTDLLFITVSHDTVSKDNRPDTMGFHIDAFNPIRSHCTLNHGIFTQSGQLFGRLPRVEFLMPTLFGNRLQLPNDVNWHSLKP